MARKNKTVFFSKQKRALIKTYKRQFYLLDDIQVPVNKRVLNNKREGRFKCYRSDVNTEKKKRVVKSADT